MPRTGRSTSGASLAGFAPVKAIVSQHMETLVKPEQIARWEATRAKGMLRYVLVSGVLSYGLPMFVVMTFIVNSSKLTPIFAAISAGLWAAGGAIFGISVWFVQERQYNKARGAG